MNSEGEMGDIQEKHYGNRKKLEPLAYFSLDASNALGISLDQG